MSLKSNYIEKLPLWTAKLYPQDTWYDKDVYFTTSDGGDAYTKDKVFLKSCLIYTCLSNQNKCLSFNGSDGRYYRNELCFDDTHGDTVASADLKTMTLDAESKKLMALWENILAEAKSAGVKKFNYISVISCDEQGAEKVPMLHAKYLFEEELKKSGMEYVIYRPTGYFYDIAKVFKPYVDKGEMQLLNGYGSVKANVVDCPDFAAFILEHMNDTNAVYNVGGKETYTYEQMAAMCFEAAKKPLVIKWAPIWLFGILANLPKIKKAGKHDIILFSKWTLSHDLVGNTEVGEGSFAEYIKSYFGKEDN